MAFELAGAENRHSTVAVLDNDCATKAELSAHPEFPEVPQLRDFRAADDDDFFCSGSHAIACASLIGGTHGVAPGNPLLLVGARADAAMQSQILRWITGLPLPPGADPRLAEPPPLLADIVSVSLYLADDPLLVETLDLLARHGRGGRGTVIVLAAGNSSQPAAQAIARHGHCITVGASTLDENGQEKVADYSNFGRFVDVYAPSGARMGRPGTNPWDKVVTAALPFSSDDPFAADELLRLPPGVLPPEQAGCYCLRAGTSTATALCAGVVALLLRADPRLTAAEVKNLLRHSAVTIPGPKEAPALRIDAAAAVAASLRSSGRRRSFSRAAHLPRE